jgi:hypothetical protein
MDRRTIVSLSLGVLSVACAVGAFEPAPSRLVVAPLADADGRSEVLGLVRDTKTGETSEGALVILQCSCLQGTREAVADAGGVYRFRNLPPGKYTVQVLFRQANVSRSFDLKPGMRARVDFRLDVNMEVIIT